MKYNEEHIQWLKEMERRYKENVRENYEEGTVLLVENNFDTKNLSFNVTGVKIVKDILEKVDEICWNKTECFIVNCFEELKFKTFSSKFLFDKKEVKPGDIVYVVTVNDGDPYGTSVIGVFTEKPNDEIIEKYNEYMDSFEEDTNEEDFENILYIDKIFEVVVS